MAGNTPTPTAQTPLNQSVQQDPLAELRNLHLPQSIDSWPWAPGWYFLIIFILSALGFSIYFLLKRKRASLYKRQALSELQSIKNHYAENKNIQESTQALSALLKKVALVHFPREKVSPLSGNAWLQFLDQLSESKSFTKGSGSLLGERLFKKLEGNENQELEELFTHCEALIRKIKKIKQPKLKKLKELKL